MSRAIRKTVILAKLETTYGVDPILSAATDAILIRNVALPKIVRDVVPRELVRPYLGGSEQLIGARRVEITFEVELAGAGTAGSVPAWGRLLRACSMAETITAANRVEYTPISDNPESMAIGYYIDGIRYVARGCRGTFMPKLSAYGLPVIEFTFWGFDTVVTVATLPNPVLTGWQRPLVLTDANAGNISLGGAYAAGVITGGTVYTSKGLELDFGSKLAHLKLLGGESIQISDREITGSMTVEQTAADEVTWRNDLNANTLTTLGFSYGTVAGNRITLFCPSVQRIAPEGEDYEGNLMMKTELRILPSAGNDDIRIVAR